MTEAPNRHLAAVMFADVAGYTALMQHDEKAALAARLRHREAVSAAAMAHGGKVIQYYGDGSLTLYASPLEAVLAAIDIQRGLAAEDFSLRIGIHLGEVSYDDQGAYGDSVNVASRIQGLASPSSVLISKKVNDELKNQPSISARPLGSFRVKNVGSPIHVYAVVAEGLEVPTRFDVMEKRRGDGRGDPTFRRRVAEALADRYVVDRELGRGGMSIVYAAQDVRHDRWVAVKVLQPELATALGAARFVREIQVASRLQHPHILPIHDSGDREGLLYYVMPYVEGESLRQHLKRSGPLSLADAVRYTREVTEALDYAHDRGVIHRDVKPGNILLSASHAIVADFGIAKAVSAAGGDKLTQTGLIMGTPEYMSPEQAGDAHVDGRSDVYSLACVTFEMLVGHPPYEGSTATGVLVSHRMDPVPSARAASPDVPEAVDAAIRRAMAKAPDDRWQSASEFGRAITSAATLGGQPRAVAGRTRRKPRVPSLAAGIALLASVALAAVVGLRTWDGSQRPVSPVTVLVAPITDLTPDGSLAHIADGLTDAVTTVVGTSRAIRPVGRFTAAALRGQDLGVATLRDEFDVAYVVEGAVRGTPQDLRFSVILTEAADGLERWSDSFGFTGEEVLERQDDVGWSVLRALEQELGGSHTPRVSRSTTRNMAAFDAYRRARRAWTSRHPVELLEVAIPEFQRAVELDPEWALPWAGLADVYNVVGAYEYGLVPPSVAFSLARQAAETALELAPGLPEALTAQASVFWNADHDVAGAERLFLQAIAANPSYAPALQWYSNLLAVLRRHDDAIARAVEAYQADVLSPVISTQLARHYYYAELYPEAVEHYGQALEMDPGFLTARLGLGMSLLQQEELGQALAQFDTAREATQGRHAAPLALIGYVWGRTNREDDARAILAGFHATRADGNYIAFEYDAAVHLGLGELSEAVAALNQALTSGSNGPMIFHIDPFLNALHGHPGFEALLDQIGVRDAAAAEANSFE
jgi:serine/threonine-protein kinase